MTFSKFIALIQSAVSLPSRDVARRTIRRRTIARSLALQNEILELRLLLSEPSQLGTIPQVIYLDFDGAENVTYSGPIMVHGINVPQFTAAHVGLGGSEENVISEVLLNLGRDFSSADVEFTTLQPSMSAYSTVFIGGTDSWLNSSEGFFGISETVDVGNLSRSDNAFVFSDLLNAAGANVKSFSDNLRMVVRHEVSHLLGIGHSLQPLVPSIDDVAYSQDVHKWVTDQGADLFSKQFGKTAMAGAGNMQFAQGAFDEDAMFSNPFGLVGDPFPYLRHFWQHGTAVDATGAFLRDIGTEEHPTGGTFLSTTYESAPFRAEQYLTGSGFGGTGATAGFSEDPDAAFGLLGRIAHLLEDMALPAHSHADSHYESPFLAIVYSTFGVFEDPDPLHDFIDGKGFSTSALPTNLQVAQFDLAEDPGRFTSWTVNSDAGKSLRSGYDMDPEFEPSAITPDLGPLEMLFTATANLSSKYDSKDVDGWLDQGKRRGPIPSLYSSWRLDELQELAQELVQHSITDSAELIRYFFGNVDTMTPTAVFPEFKGSTADTPAIVTSTSFRVTAMATDQDTGDSGIGKDLFKFQYQVKAPGQTDFSPLKDPTPQNFVMDANNNLVLNSFHFEDGSAVDPDFASKHGALAQPIFRGEIGSTYHFQVTVEDGAGNKKTSDAWVQVGGVDVVTVLDRSGSMDDENKIDQAKSAAAAFVDVMQDGDKIGVVSYSDNTSVDYSLTRIDGTSERTAAKTAIASISTGGDTGIGLGVASADAQLDRFESDPVRAMIVLTDGMHNFGSDPLDVIGNTVDQDIRIFTIGLGSDADGSLLAEMARLRNGTYYPSTSGDQLQKIYTELRGEITNQGLVLNQEGTIQQGESQTALFHVDSTTGSITIGVNWPGSNLDLELIAPDGTVIDHAAAMSSPYISLVDTDTFESFTVQTPLSGQWQVRVIGVDVAAAGEQFSLFANADTAAKGLLQFVNSVSGQPSSNFNTGDEILLQMRLTAPLPVLGADAGVTITLPDGQIRRTILTDEGGIDDVVAHDGIYGSRILVTQPGPSKFEVAADFETNLGAPMTLIERGSIFATGAAIPENVPPVATDDTFTVTAGIALSDNVMTNTNPNGADSDQDGGTLSINTTSVTGPAKGNLILNADGGFTYTALTGATGSDSFVYTLNDGQGGSDTATVTIAIESPSQHFDFDIDGNGVRNGFQDSVLIFAWMLGPDISEAEFERLIPLNAAQDRDSVAEIRAYLDGSPEFADIDGNGSTNAFQDSVLIFAWMLGPDISEADFQKIIPANAAQGRDSVFEIQAYLNNLQGTATAALQADSKSVFIPQSLVSKVATSNIVRGSIASEPISNSSGQIQADATVQLQEAPEVDPRVDNFNVKQELPVMSAQTSVRLDLPFAGTEGLGTLPESLLDLGL